METQVTTIHQLPMSDVMTLAKNFAESGMFTDAKQAQQAFVKIMAGQEIGIPPFAAMSGVHIIQGKPTIGAGLIASRVKGSGKYDYKVVENTDTNCSIDFYQGKEKIGNSTFNLADAKKAQTKNLDKFPKNMLFARAISNGVKWFCPDVFSGPVYTPEEMAGVGEQTQDITHEDVTHEADIVEDTTILQRLDAARDIFELQEVYKGLTKADQKKWAVYTKELKEKLTIIPNEDVTE